MDKVSLIYKVLSGDASPDEKVMLENWIKLSDSNNEEFQDIKLLWENTPAADFFERDSDKGLRKIKAKINVRRTKTFLEKVIRIIMILGVAILFSLILYVLVIRNRKTIPDRTNFNNVSLKVICDSLEKRYGVSIEISPAVAGCRMSATFYNQTPDVILIALSENLKVDLERVDKNAFEITGNPCIERDIIH